MRKIAYDYYLAAWKDLKTIDRLNRDLQKHFPQLALPQKAINSRLKLAEKKVEKAGSGQITVEEVQNLY